MIVFRENYSQSSSTIVCTYSGPPSFFFLVAIHEEAGVGARGEQGEWVSTLGQHLPWCNWAKEYII